MIKAKHSKIPIDFAPELRAALQAEGDKLGLRLSSYVKFLIATHPSRQTAAQKRSAQASKKRIRSRP